MIDLTPIFQAVVALLGALITYKLIPWIKSKTSEQQQANLYAAARIAVYAAEQLYGAGRGDEKLDYAIAALKRAGFDLDKELVRETIEEIVNGMNRCPQVLFVGDDNQIHPPENETNTQDVDEPSEV